MNASPICVQACPAGGYKSVSGSSACLACEVFALFSRSINLTINPLPRPRVPHSDPGSEVAAAYWGLQFAHAYARGRVSLVILWHPKCPVTLVSFTTWGMGVVLNNG